MRNWLVPAAGGALSALPLVLALAAPSGLFFALLVPLPLFLVGLSSGAQMAVVSSAVSGLILLATGGVALVIGALVVLFGPVVLLSRQALLSRPGADGAVEWYPAGLLAAWLAAVGIGWLALMVLLLPDAANGGLEQQLQVLLLERLQDMIVGLPDDQLDLLARRLAAFGLGAGVISWLVLLALNAVLAQGVLARYGWNRRPSPDLAELRLPAWLGWALPIAAAGAILLPGDGGFVLRNLAVVLLLPFFFAGLQARTLVLVGFYVMLVLLSWPAVLVAGLGLIDHWADLRRRAASGGSGREDE